MNCCWVIKGRQCGEDATVRHALALCDNHWIMLQLNHGVAARQSAKYHGLSAFPGVCYFALLPDGHIKIGYSNTDRLLGERMKALGRKYGAPVILLASIPGGFVAEAVMHARFKEYRVPANGERFVYSAEMAEYIASLGEGAQSSFG